MPQRECNVASLDPLRESPVVKAPDDFNRNERNTGICDFRIPATARTGFVGAICVWGASDHGPSALIDDIVRETRGAPINEAADKV